MGKYEDICAQFGFDPTGNSRSPEPVRDYDIRSDEPAIETARRARQRHEEIQHLVELGRVPPAEYDQQ